MSQNDASNARPVAFFDFDGTLTTGDTLMPFLKFVVGTPTYYAKLALVSPVLAAYFAKLLRNDITKQIVLKQYLAGYHIDELFELGQRFSEEVIPTMLRPAAIERLEWHQRQGHHCVLLSASLNIYLENLISKLGFCGLISSSLLCGPGSLVSGRLKGENCFGDVKVEKVKEWLFNKKPSVTYGYGDSLGDYPFLRLVDEGWVLRNGIFVKIKEVQG